MHKEHKKIAIIAGGSGYVGNAIAQELVARSWHVISLSRSTSSVAEVETVRCDITNEKELMHAVGNIIQGYGTIDACIHAAAAPTTRASLIDTPLESFDIEFSTSVRSAYVLAKKITPYMKAGSAFIGITTRSIEPGVSVEARIGAYLSAKVALRTLLRVLSVELKEKGIRVYAVAPSFMPGGLNKHLPEGVRTLLSRQADGSIASPYVVGELVADLCTGANTAPGGSSIVLPSEVVTPL